MAKKKTTGKINPPPGAPLSKGQIIKSTIKKVFKKKKPKKEIPLGI